MELDILKIRSFLGELKTSSDHQRDSSNSKRPCENSGSESELVNLEDCLRKNKHCISELTAAFSHLQSIVDSCSRELELVRENITSVESGKSIEARFLRIHVLCSSPYFKDSDCFPAPPNVDVALRKANGFVDLCNLRKSVPWTADRKHIVEQIIRASEIERWTNIARKAGTEQFCDFEKKTLAELIHTRKDEYDWMKISVTDLKNAHSPFECRSVWFNYLHPAINKGKWSKEEDEKLVEIVEKYNCHDWAKIAEELNTNRSPYQCISHYSVNLRPVSNRPWTKEEEVLLQKTVAKYCFGIYYPWRKIAWHFNGRSKTEIVQHWDSINADTKKGRYSLEEDIIIAAGLKYFGEDYPKISDYLPNRNVDQVRYRVQFLQSHQIDLSPWTPAEDRLLCQLLKRYNYGSWANISTHFSKRSSESCYARYLNISALKKKLVFDSVPVVNKSIANYCGTLDDLWKHAERVMRENFIVNPNESLSNERLMDDLVTALFPKHKAVRRKYLGCINKGIFKLFSSCYVQKGGKSINVVTQELLPYIAKDTIITLNLLNAKLILPEDTETIENDSHLPRVDKTVLKFIISNKELVQKVYVSMDRVRETNKRVLYLCPPNYPTLVGLRTLLLKRQSLKDQAEGQTANPYTDPSGESSTGETAKSDEFEAACKLWNNRFQFLFTWAVHASRNYPNEACPLAPKSPLKFQSYGYKEVRKPEKISRKKIKPTRKDYNDPNVKRRVYKKTGKFKIGGDSNGAVRRSSRRSRGSEAETDSTSSMNYKY